MLRDARVWVAIAIGAAAWAPLLAWNLDNADAGLRFQLVDRHPWAFHADGALVRRRSRRCWSRRCCSPRWRMAAWRGAHGSDDDPVARYFALLGGLLVLGFFALGLLRRHRAREFPLAAAGLPRAAAAACRRARALAALAARARRGSLRGAGPGRDARLLRRRSRARAARASSPRRSGIPSNFAGWDALADAVREQRAAMPAGHAHRRRQFQGRRRTGLRARRSGHRRCCDHPLNRKHGRAPQLQLWGLQQRRSRATGATRRCCWWSAPAKCSTRTCSQRYHALCAQVGPLPPPRVVNIDHGRQRFLLFALDREARDGRMHDAGDGVDRRAAAGGARRRARSTCSGWAFKDGVGLDRVEVTARRQRRSAAADYGSTIPAPQRYWQDLQRSAASATSASARRSSAGAVTPGRHWLGLRLHGRDGSVEDWPRAAGADRRLSASAAPGRSLRAGRSPPARSSRAVAISGRPISAVGSLRFDRVEQGDAQAFGLEAAGAVEGLLGIDIAFDLGARRACGSARAWCRARRSGATPRRITHTAVRNATLRAGHRAQLRDRARRGRPACRAARPSSSATWSEPITQASRLHARRSLRPWPRPGAAPARRGFAGQRRFVDLRAGDVEGQAQPRQQFAPVAARSRPGSAARCTSFRRSGARARSICASCWSICGARPRSRRGPRPVPPGGRSAPCCCSHSRWRSISRMASRTGSASSPATASISARAVRRRASRASAASSSSRTARWRRPPRLAQDEGGDRRDHGGAAGAAGWQVTRVTGRDPMQSASLPVAANRRDAGQVPTFAAQWLGFDRKGRGPNIPRLMSADLPR